MTTPARAEWWDDVVSKDQVKLNDTTYLLWGDRVRRLGPVDGDGKVLVSARGGQGTIDASDLGGTPLLELYFIDVGQGDGILIVTPEGHHILVDGGLQRTRQGTGKSAADFVDWKFARDYLTNGNAGDNNVRLDAMIASHADRDHYGGLRDLIDRAKEAEVDELRTDHTTVEAFYHQGLCPQLAIAGEGEDLGPKEDGHFTRLLSDRASATAGVSANPGNAPPIRGEYKWFMEDVLLVAKKDGSLTPIQRLSHLNGFLPGFSASQGESVVAIEVLAPIEHEVNGKPALSDLGNEGENKNGHSIALRLTHKERSFLLTGDLNEQSQTQIMQHYGQSFETTWRSDVAKACHHGSHHVRFSFLQGVNALATVFSSGDANTYDHPRAWVLGAAALSGRVIADATNDRLVAPLVYSTEIARSIALKGVSELRRYADVQKFGEPKTEHEEKISGEQTLKKWRLALSTSKRTYLDYPPLSNVKAMRSLIYGLVNVRTDGERLLFAVRNEGNHKWSYESMEASEIESAIAYAPP